MSEVSSDPKPVIKIDEVEATAVKAFFIAFNYDANDDLKMIYYYFKDKTARLYEPVKTAAETADETAEATYDPIKLKCMGTECKAKAELRDDILWTQDHGDSCKPPMNNDIVTLKEEDGVIKGVGISCELKNYIPKNSDAGDTSQQYTIGLADDTEQVAPEASSSKDPSTPMTLDIPRTAHLDLPTTGSKRPALSPMSIQNADNKSPNKPDEKKPRMAGENPVDNQPDPKDNIDI